MKDGLRAMHKAVFAMLVALVVGGAAVVNAGAGEVPTLLPGAAVVVKGTHLSCSLTATSVTCQKAGGLRATITKSGAVREGKASGPLFAASVKAKQLSVNGGFNLTGVVIYCHVYPNGVSTMTCSVLGGNASGVANSSGFDISDRSFVLFRYDKQQARQDVKTIPQP